MTTRFSFAVSLLLSAALSTPVCAFQEGLRDADWPVYGGNNAGNRYSSLTQVNKENVKKLQPAWTYDTGENNKPGERGMDIQCQPIVIDGIMYGTTPRLKVFAIEAATGRELWKFDPFEGKRPRFHPMRGVVYWAEGKDKRILFTAGPSLFALNAETGKLVETFGKNGEVDFHDGLGDKETYGYDPYQFNIRNTTPGVIYKNLLITGSSVSEGGDALPGHIRAFDVRTGKVAWVFRTIPLPGEYGYDTWSKDSYKKLGGANCWAGMVIDEKRGMVFLGTGSPSVDFYGGPRKGINLFANCVIALDARSGRRVWHYQTVHHDLWDRDIPCPPNLIRVRRNGRMVDAVAQATKDGYIFIFDRDTGKPLFPVKEVPVPNAKALPGDQPWPTQPVPVKPAPFANQTLTEADITTRTPEAHAYVLDRFRNSNKGPKNQPPDTLGGLLYGIGGGAEWGGTAADPQGVVYVNGNNMLWWLKMRDSRKSDGKQGQALSRGQVLFNTNCAACHATEAGTASAATQAYPVLKDIGQRMNREQIAALLETGRGRMPSFQHISKEDRAAIVDFLLKVENKPAANDIHAQTQTGMAKTNAVFPHQPPYINNGNVQFRDQDNYPAIKPPWGTLNAIDMNTGEYRWKVTLGEYPELTRQGVPPTGTENHGGPLVTAGGLLFIAATYDEKLRAFDTETGKVVWEYKLPAGGFATPVTYMVNGKQYIAIAAGGTRYGLKPGGSYIAFALP
ncbi:outer membrane protein assembly factor BamB family protein [Dyadobacter fermentans]|uniref:Quinoprotein glucose dehydrogenase n=1 Tax=Dyadobacter fermentans (strain ATCC 700827 / DSM 18053 / CIP 107007 / KCTC 52180 / NS114) TaxID=471854 RepID=C6W426_DYAFD|nr:PQQ-binding-like beta-propeller repeat protein [Dyadobacter fermentans]ACT92263.1 Quinoprotein glucose dehydrogenase [Dyadobacter fermentans DSM 18053]